MPDMTSYDQESLATQVALDPDPVVLPIDQHATPPITASSLSSATSHSSPPHILLPIPTQSTNQSQPAFALSRAFVSTDDDWTSLPAEVLNADISIARKFNLVQLDIARSVTLCGMPVLVIASHPLHSVTNQRHGMSGRSGVVDGTSLWKRPSLN